MALIVQKYGGAVLSDIAKIRSIAEAIADLSEQGHRVVAVVSAMGHTTDDLVRLANSVSLDPPKRELDMLLSVGERITMSLLSMAITETGRAKAVSYTGSQVGIITDNRHSDARIVAVRSERLQKALQEGYVVVVAGFQGVSVDKEITTLGRGGSDTTALALAAALGADRCDLIKEVPGIFSSDPTMIPEAVPIPEMDYASAKALSLGGARIMKEACIEIAQRNGIEIRVGGVEQNTIIRREAEKPFFSAALKQKIVKYELPGMEDLGVTTYEDEIVFTNGRIFLYHDASKAAAKFKGVIASESGFSKITVVGDLALEAAKLAKSGGFISEVEFLRCQTGVAEIVFKDPDPKAALKRIHQELLKKFPGVTKE